MVSLRNYWRISKQTVNILLGAYEDEDKFYVEVINIGTATKVKASQVVRKFLALLHRSRVGQKSHSVCLEFTRPKYCAARKKN